jgi:hypothetical protein
MCSPLPNEAAQGPVPDLPLNPSTSKGEGEGRRGKRVAVLFCLIIAASYLFSLFLPEWELVYQSTYPLEALEIDFVPFPIGLQLAAIRQLPSFTNEELLWWLALTLAPHLLLWTGFILLAARNWRATLVVGVLVLVLGVVRWGIVTGPGSSLDGVYLLLATEMMLALAGWYGYRAFHPGAFNAPRVATGMRTLGLALLGVAVSVLWLSAHTRAHSDQLDPHYRVLRDEWRRLSPEQQFVSELGGRIKEIKREGLTEKRMAGVWHRVGVGTALLGYLLIVLSLCPQPVPPLLAANRFSLPGLFLIGAGALFLIGGRSLPWVEFLEALQGGLFIAAGISPLWRSRWSTLVVVLAGLAGAGLCVGTMVLDCCNLSRLILCVWYLLASSIYAIFIIDELTDKPRKAT